MLIGSWGLAIDSPLLILEVTELQNNTSVFCQGSNMSAIFAGVFRLTPSISHMHYTPPSFEEPGCHSAS